MIVRLLILLVFLALVFIVVEVAERLRGKAKNLIPPGLTLVVSQGCRECVRARAALDSHGADYDVMDAHEAERYGVQSLTVPYAFIGSATGDLVMVRRGASIAHDAHALAEASAHVFAPKVR